MSGSATITAAIVTQNEARNLAELLPRLDWVHEIVVVDDGSRDATVQIAQRYGCRVCCRRFDTFAGQRNHALQLAEGEWVLSIDADERPTPRLIAEILRQIVVGRYAAFRVPIRSSIFGRQMRCSGTQDDCPVRLFRRQAVLPSLTNADAQGGDMAGDRNLPVAMAGYGTRTCPPARMACRAAGPWVGDVHETLLVSGPVGRLDGWLQHQTLPDLHAFLAKMHQYTTLEANARLAAGRRPCWPDAWIAPPVEVFRRLFWKQGILDGPAGWAFCLLSGLSQWVLANEHRRLWESERKLTTDN